MKFSIITPSFNQGSFLARCLASVEDQAKDGVEVEHILFDGASNDDTVSILQAWQGRALNWTSEPDSGQSDALAKALAKADGDILGWLNTDEYYEPHVFEMVHAAFDRNPDAVLVYGDFRRVAADGSEIRVNRQWDYDSEVGRVVTPIAQTCASFMRMDRVREVGGFDLAWNYVMDWDLLIRLMRDQQAWVRLSTVLGNYTMHRGAKTSSAPNLFAAEIKLLRRRELPFMPPAQMEWYRRWQSLRMVKHIAEAGALPEKVYFKLFRQVYWREEFGSPGPLGVLWGHLRTKRL